jgi:hypothetical protein
VATYDNTFYPNSYIRAMNRAQYTLPTSKLAIRWRGAFFNGYSGHDDGSVESAFASVHNDVYLVLGALADEGRIAGGPCCSTPSASA